MRSVRVKSCVRKSSYSKKGFRKGGLVRSHRRKIK